MHCMGYTYKIIPHCIVYLILKWNRTSCLFPFAVCKIFSSSLPEVTRSCQLAEDARLSEDCLWGCKAKKEWPQLVQALQSPLQNEAARPLSFKQNATDNTESVSFLRFQGIPTCHGVYLLFNVIMQKGKVTFYSL